MHPISAPWFLLTKEDFSCPLSLSSSDREVLDCWCSARDLHADLCAVCKSHYRNRLRVCWTWAEV